LDASYEANDKLFKVGGSWIGMSGTTAHFPVLRRALTTLAADELKLNSRDEVFDTFLKLHPKLKETYFLNPKEEDADPYESSQFTALIANAAGIFGVYSYREVFEFDRFWSVGTGRSFALGAMYANYDKAKSARELAELGVRAGCEFDKNSSGPVRAHTIKLKTKD
jgi:ATP-dependent HslUV protease, peptidase subunit HslV